MRVYASATLSNLVTVSFPHPDQTRFNKLVLFYSNTLATRREITNTLNSFI